MTVDTRHLVDPELAPFLDAMPAFELTRETLPTLRQAIRDRLELPEDPTILASVETTTRSVPGRRGDPELTLVVHRPREPTGAILHIHGGGYVMGDAASLAPTHRSLALALGCMIVSVDYRLAPETPAPGALEDCYAALTWLEREADDLEIDRKRIGVMGESAGGGLAAALALLARDRGEHRLAFQHLIYPMLDDRTGSHGEPHAFAGEFIWDAAKNRFGWASLLGFEPGGEHVSPYAAPARATDLSGLPPAYLAVGALDLFVDENLDFARRLVRAGVATELHLYPGAFHGFHLQTSAAVTRQAEADSRSALARALTAR